MVFFEKRRSTGKFINGQTQEGNHATEANRETYKYEHVVGRL